MGKKSRKQITKKATASPGKLKGAIRNLLQNMDGLFEKQDWKGVVTLAESQENGVVEALGETTTFVYSFSGFFFQTAVSYMKIGNRKKAIHYYEKTIQTTTKPSTKEGAVGAASLRKKCESCLVDCYLSDSRCGDAAALVRKFTPYHHFADPQCLQKILGFFSVLMMRCEFEIALGMAQEYLDEHRLQNPQKTEGKNYIEFNMLKVIGRCHQDLYDYQKAIETLTEIFEFCPYEMSIAFKEADILSNLGRSYGALGNIEKASYYLDRVTHLVSRNGLQKEFEVHKEIVINMAEIHFSLQNHEKEAIACYERALKLCRVEAPRPSDEKLPYAGMEHLRGIQYRRLGVAHLRLRTWKEAIESLQTSVSLLTKSNVQKCRDTEISKSYQDLGRAYLERYCWDEELALTPKERKNSLQLSLQFSQKALDLIDRGNLSERHVYLDIAQQHYLLGNKTDSHEMLKRFLDFSFHAGPSYCECCHQISPKENMMQVCKGCKVASYCSGGHQAQAWKQERTGHRKLCPLLNTWRLVKKGQESVECASEMFNKYFSSTFKTVIRSSSKSKKIDLMSVQQREDLKIERNNSFENREIEILLSIA